MVVINSSVNAPLPTPLSYIPPSVLSSSESPSFSAITSVITLVSHDSYVGLLDGSTSALTGICVDLWNRTANDLSLEYSLEIVNIWPKMLEAFEDNRAQVIMQKMDEGQFAWKNFTK